jgi:hypothetical protein
MSRPALVRALTALGCLTAGPAWAAVAVGESSDGGADLVRRVIQTLVAVGVLVIMARPAADEPKSRSGSALPESGSFTPRPMSSASLASRGS